jgi:uncharacterized caspase-like protein
LRFARADAQAFESLLTQSSLTHDIEVHSLLDADATRTNVLKLIGVDVARQAKPNDIVLFFFAGHGSPEIYSGLDKISRFLVCHDTLTDSLLSTSLDVQSDLARVVARLQAQTNIFMIDACFSGFEGGRGICGPIIAERRRQHRTAARLDDLKLGTGTIFLGACGNDEVAAETRDLGHGVFTYHLLQYLQGPGDSHIIGIPTLYDLVYRNVHSFTAGRQNPVLWGNMKGASLPRFTPEQHL